MLAIMENELLNKQGKRGFAAMDPDRQRLIASKGGKAAHEQGVAHEWNREEAKQAGKKGGTIAAKRKFINRTENDGCDHFL
jgi:uncharacterized protein